MTEVKETIVDRSDDFVPSWGSPKRTMCWRSFGWGFGATLAGLSMMVAIFIGMYGLGQYVEVMPKDADPVQMITPSLGDAAYLKVGGLAPIPTREQFPTLADDELADLQWWVKEYNRLESYDQLTDKELANIRASAQNPGCHPDVHRWISGMYAYFAEKNGYNPNDTVEDE